MIIRPTNCDDLPAVMSLYEYARNLMRQNGNFTQWINGYPSEDLIRTEIADGHSFVGVDEHGEIVVTFCLIIGEDPTYRVIYGGEWLNDEPYGVIHRMATSGKQKGVGELCFNWCLGRCKNVRVDTHRDNHAMQHILLKLGFVYCGIIHVADGTERLAFQKLRGSLSEQSHF